MRNEESRQILGSDLRINTDSTDKPVDGRLVEYRGSLRKRDKPSSGDRGREKTLSCIQRASKGFYTKHDSAILGHFLFLSQKSNLVAISKLAGHCRENVSTRSALWLQRGDPVLLEVALHPVTAPP